MPRRFSLASLVGMAVLLSAQVRAQVLGPNLVLNPHFDRDLEAWSSSSYFVWSALDADDLPTSGSAVLFAPPTSLASMSQCVGLLAGARYRFSAKVRRDPNQGTGPLQMDFYLLPGCGGNPLQTEFLDVIAVPPSSWQAIGKTVPAPPGTESASVSANLICGPPRICPGSALQFDDVFVGVDGSEPSADFHTLPPCRLVDTRSGTAVKGFRQVLVSALGCGVPPTARAVSLNVTVTGADGEGNLRLYPANTDVPGTSVANFVPGQTRANNAIVALSAGAELEIYAQFAVAGASVHVILDVNGYFE